MVTLVDIRLEFNAKYLLDWLWLFLLATQLRQRLRQKAQTYLGQRVESTKLGEISFALLDLSPQNG